MTLKVSNSSREETVQKRRLEAAVTALAAKKFMAPELSLVDWFERRRELLKMQSRSLLSRRNATCQVPPREPKKPEL